ncbi:uncharacterized protein LOC103711759 [Phoenix dactylifera]|uniref:Uncharacterized protein LOC103711759 n=1 Tax=Phoenix dactylifera TaxID=42345 RepID=A0A8B7CCC2_PHODC|nr:uncharacterized protein LOC103711759 [Phoenix dactylifera]
MRAAVLIRTSSVPARPQLVADQDSGAGVSFLRRSLSARFYPRSAALHVDVKERRESPSYLHRRARSEADLTGSDCPIPIMPRSPLPEEKLLDRKGRGLDFGAIGTEAAVAAAVPEEEEEVVVEYSGGGVGKGSKIGGGGASGGRGSEEGDQSENRRIGDYYQEMLRADPGNPLLLQNYGRFLHEVEGDAKRAEEYYGRAILASPGDGEVLSLYGKLVWETHRDGERAETYFERAVEASPDDCYVLGSYAKFLWDAEEEADEDDGERGAIPPLVEAF